MVRCLSYFGWAGMLGLAAFAAYYYQAEEARLQQVPAIECDPEQGCQWTNQAESPIRLRFMQPASGTTPFPVSVMAPSGSAVSLRLDMEGMAMGPAAFQLLPDKNGGYTAKVVLPACIQGRSDWRGALSINGKLHIFKFTAKM